MRARNVIFFMNTNLWLIEVRMRIEIFHASKFGNGAKVIESLDAHWSSRVRKRMYLSPQYISWNLLCFRLNPKTDNG
jgi:hypothetical protein